jgi:hypothetical protein
LRGQTVKNSGDQGLSTKTEREPQEVAEEIKYIGNQRLTLLQGSKVYHPKEFGLLCFSSHFGVFLTFSRFALANKYIAVTSPQIRAELSGLGHLESMIAF